MSAQLALNVQVFSLEKEKDLHVAHIGVSHYGTDSRIVFRCEYVPKQQTRWGVTPIEALGDDFSYFGQFIGVLAAKGAPVQFTKENMSVIGQYNIDRIKAYAAALSFLLNEMLQSEDQNADSFLTPENINEKINDRVFIPRKDVQNSVAQLYLLPLGVSQREFAIGQAKICDAFNLHQPRHFIDGVNSNKGVVENILKETEQDKPLH